MCFFPAVLVLWCALRGLYPLRGSRALQTFLGTSLPKSTTLPRLALAPLPMSLLEASLPAHAAALASALATALAPLARTAAGRSSDADADSTEAPASVVATSRPATADAGLAGKPVSPPPLPPAAPLSGLNQTTSPRTPDTIGEAAVVLLPNLLSPPESSRELRGGAVELPSSEGDAAEASCVPQRDTGARREEEFEGRFPTLEVALHCTATGVCSLF